MRDDYKILEVTGKLEVEVEKKVIDRLILMEGYSKLTRSEITNVALKRFISQHKDFMPPEEAKR